MRRAVPPERYTLRARTTEKIIVSILMVCSAVSVVILLGITGVLIKESIPFFAQVSLVEFLTENEWTPLFASKKFGILPLVVGTLLTSGIALLVAVPIGVSVAVFLSEFVSARIRRWLKPTIEVLALVPTVVYGYFALVMVTPFLQKLIPQLSVFNALSAGIVMGIMLIPLITSLSEEALRAVPYELREAAYGLGSTRTQTAFRVVVPAAWSGVVAAIMLATARAFGETMIVAIAAGQMPILTFNPLGPVETMTTYIVQVTMGDVPYGSLEHRSVYGVALTLLLLTGVVILVSFWLRSKFTEKYL